jgi:hypothetical protein
MAGHYCRGIWKTLWAVVETVGHNGSPVTLPMFTFLWAWSRTTDACLSQRLRHRHGYPVVVVEGQERAPRRVLDANLFHRPPASSVLLRPVLARKGNGGRAPSAQAATEAAVRKSRRGITSSRSGCFWSLSSHLVARSGISMANVIAPESKVHSRARWDQDNLLRQPVGGSVFIAEVAVCRRVVCEAFRFRIPFQI